MLPQRALTCALILGAGAATALTPHAPRRSAGAHDVRIDIQHLVREVTTADALAIYADNPDAYGNKVDFDVRRRRENGTAPTEGVLGAGRRKATCRRPRCAAGAGRRRTGAARRRGGEPAPCTKPPPCSPLTLHRPPSQMYHKLLPQFSCCNDPHFTILSGGLNAGDLSDLVLATCGAQLHGFEVQENMYEKLLLKYSAHGDRVVLNHLGLSDADREEPITDLKGEGTGLFTRFRGEDVWNVTKSVIRTTSVGRYAKKERLRLCLAIIDVEGHEAKVIQGMDLARTRIPAFAYELGGTWRDERMQGTWTQADAAKFVDGMGYNVYLIGKDDLLHVDAAFFEASAVEANNEGGGFFVQGNALAVHRSHLVL